MTGTPLERPAAPARAAAPPPDPRHGAAPVLGGGTDFVRVPPDRRYVWVPLDSRRASLSGLGLYSATRRRGRLGSAGLAAAVRVAGPRVVPFPRERWTPPMGAEAWAALVEAWRALPPHDGLALHEKPQVGRSGFGVLLMRAGRPVAFVKTRPAGGRGNELPVLRALQEARLPALRTPAVLAAGEVAGWTWLAQEPMPPRGRGGRRRLLDVPRFLGQVQPVLAQCLPRPAGTPEHWEPAHGDLTAWNTRVDRSGRTWVFDWEDAGWGPPGADDTYYRATAAVLLGRPAGTAPVEAVEWWLSTVASRARTGDDAELSARLTSTLQSMRAPAL